MKNLFKGLLLMLCAVVLTLSTGSSSGAPPSKPEQMYSIQVNHEMTDAAINYFHVEADNRSVCDQVTSITYCSCYTDADKPVAITNTEVKLMISVLRLKFDPGYIANSKIYTKSKSPINHWPALTKRC